MDQEAKDKLTTKLEFKLNSVDGKLTAAEYDAISSKLFPKVKPYINMIDNKRGPF